MRVFDSNQFLDITLSLVSLPFFCFVLGSLGLLLGIPIFGGYAFIALILSVLWLIWRNGWQKGERKNTGIHLLLFLILQAFLMFYGSLHTDNAIDSQIYHKPAALLLAEGWNPVYEANVYSFYERKGIDSQTMRVSHLQYFPKGQWIVNAIFYRLSGNINLGDYINYVFMIAVFIVSYSAFREWLKIGRAFALLASIVIALNPVAIGNTVNGHIDGNLGNTLLIFLLASVCFFENGNRRWGPWILMTAIYGCSLKHTGIPYFGTVAFVLTIPLVWNCLRTKLFQPKISSEVIISTISETAPSLKKWLVLMLPIPAAVLILCANPYITNTLDHTSPFYPLHSFDRENHPVENILKDWYSIESFEKADPIQRFAASYFLMYPQDINTKKSVNYDFSKIGMVEFRYLYCDLNTLGWPFALALLLSIFMLFFLPRSEDSWIILALLVTILIQPHSWWARFVPQIWAFPVLVFCIIMARFQGIQWVKKRLVLLCGLCLFMLLSQGILCLVYQHGKMICSLQLEQKFHELAESTSDPCILIGNYVPEEPKFYTTLPSFCFYYQRLFQDQEFTVSQIQHQAAGRHLIPGIPVAHWDKALLYSASKPLPESDVVYDDIELDRHDVEFSKIIPGILWKLKMRWNQLSDQIE